MAVDNRQVERQITTAASVWLVEFERKLYEKNDFNDFLAQIEAIVKVPRLYIVAGLAAFLVCAFLIGNAGLLLCNIVGFVYPAFASVKAIESRESEDADKKWLAYWVVFALLVVFEFCVGVVVGFIPFYSVLKCALLVWLLAPGTHNGSMVVYRKVIKPIFLRAEEEGARAILPAGVQKLAQD